MARHGQTANGVAHFAPVQKLEAPQIDIRNPFKDYILMAMEQDKIDQGNRKLDLYQKGQDLEELMFYHDAAYNAGNDEKNRQQALELEKLKGEYGIKEANLKNAHLNKAIAKEGLEDKAWDFVSKVIKDYKETVRNNNKSGNTDHILPFNDYIYAHPEYEAGVSKFGAKNIHNAVTALGQQRAIDIAIGASNIGLDGTYNGKGNNLQNDGDSDDW